MKKKVILDKSFNFSLDIISLYRNLSLNKEYVLSKQVLRSGTSIGANIEEIIKILTFIVKTSQENPRNQQSHEVMRTQNSKLKTQN